MSNELTVTETTQRAVTLRAGNHSVSIKEDTENDFMVRAGFAIGVCSREQLELLYLCIGRVLGQEDT